MKKEKKTQPSMILMYGISQIPEKFSILCQFNRTDLYLINRFKFCSCYTKIDHESLCTLGRTLHGNNAQTYNVLKLLTIWFVSFW